MEKKIRVWDKECTSCFDCHLYQMVDDDYSGTHKICGYTGWDIFEYCNSKEINPNCPFAKPLSKEDIEGYGFKYRNEYICQIYYNDDMTKVLKYCNDTGHLLISAVIEGFTGTRFDGYIRNLQEFKLLLKQLNIE